MIFSRFQLIRIILFLFYSLGTVQSFAQDAGLVMIAFNKEIGFILDSNDIKNNNLFPFIERNSLKYLVVIKKSSSYEIQVSYENGNDLNYQYSAETIRREWEKVKPSMEDSSQVSDYKQAKLFYPEISSFVLLTSGFLTVEQTTVQEKSKINGGLFLDFGTVLSFISDGDASISFQSNGGFVKNRMAFSLNFQYGETFNDDVANLYGFPSSSWKYRELGISGGYVLSKKIIYCAISTGFTQVMFHETRYEWLGWWNSNKVYDEKENEIGFPIILDVSALPTSKIGFSMKYHVTFSNDSRPTYHIGLGMRIGRIDHD